MREEAGVKELSEVLDYTFKDPTLERTARIHSCASCSCSMHDSASRGSCAHRCARFRMLAVLLAMKHCSKCWQNRTRLHQDSARPFCAMNASRWCCSSLQTHNKCLLGTC